MDDGRRVAGTVAVVALVALAGCSSLGDTDPGRTPFDVPSQPPSVGGAGPPGITNDSVESPFLLVQSHVGVLSLDSFRVVRERTVRTAAGTVVRSFALDARVSTDRQRYRVRIDRDGTALSSRERGTRVVYAATRDTPRQGARQERVLAARLGPDGTVRSATRLTAEFDPVVSPEDVLSADPNYRDRLYRYLTVTDEAVVRPLQPGGGPEVDATTGTRYRVEALTTSDRRLLASGPNETVSNVSVAFVADERGLIVETVASYVVVRGGEQFSVRERIAYPALGDVSVQRPDWFDDAAEAATTETVGDETGSDTRVRDPSDDDQRGRAPTDRSPPLTAPHDAADDSSPGPDRSPPSTASDDAGFPVGTDRPASEAHLAARLASAPTEP
jgi:hypothetical protein